MYISFYITDARHHLVFQYLPSANCPSFKNLWTRISTACPDLTVSDSGALHGTVGKNLVVSKYYSDASHLYYFCLSSASDRDAGDVGLMSPTGMEPFVLMSQIDLALLEYFDKEQLSVKKVVNNHDQLALIFNCLVNSGEPSVNGMYSNRIKTIVPMKSDFSKILNSTAQSLQHVGQNLMSRPPHFPQHQQQQQVAPLQHTDEEEIVPWRSAKVNSRRNEFYVDVRESVEVVVERAAHRSTSRGTPAPLQLVTGCITGVVDCRCYLSGTPTVEVTFNNHGCDLGTPALHDCVELDGVPEGPADHTTLKFIPPDGKFRLMEYSVTLGDPRAYFGLVTPSFEDGLGKNNDEFEVAVSVGGSTKVDAVADLQVALQFSAPLTQGQAEQTEYKVRILRTTHGRYSQGVHYDEGKWVFDAETPTGVLAVLRGCIERCPTTPQAGTPVGVPPETPTGTAARLSRATVSYRHEQQLASEIQVEAINIRGTRGGRELFKGVKYVTVASAVELRG